MFGKKKQERAAFRDLMAKMILLYVKGQWDDALGTASVIEVGLEGIATAPRMEICLYHVESMRLRIAYRRRDAEPTPDLIGTKWFPNLYIPGHDSTEPNDDA